MKAWIESRDEMEKILERALVGRLWLADDGEPYVVPLNFVYADGRIFFHTGLEGRKLEIIKKNPRVCFEVDEQLEVVINEQACLSTAYYRSVIAWGAARLLEETDEKMKALEQVWNPHVGSIVLRPLHLLKPVTHEFQIGHMLIQ